MRSSAWSMSRYCISQHIRVSYALFLHYDFKESITIYTHSHKVKKIHRDVGNVGRKSSSSDRAEVRAHGWSRCIHSWCLLSLLLLPTASTGRLGRPGAETPMSRPEFDRNAQELGASLLIVIRRRTNTSSQSHREPRTADRALASDPTKPISIVVVVMRTVILSINFGKLVGLEAQTEIKLRSYW
jgi:hypothetical protein